MVTTHVFIAVSLDGYIARQDGDIDWLVRTKIGSLWGEAAMKRR